MSDDEFVRELESCSLAESDFGHAAHVRAAYLYLRASDFPAALARMRGAIRNFAAHMGKPERYHETITVAYLALIGQCLRERGDNGGWPAFAQRNPELFEPDLLQRYYSRAQLDSEVARRTFVLPDPSKGGAGG